MIVVGLLIGGMFLLSDITTKKANELIESFNKYEFDLEKLETGMLFDFKDNNYGLIDQNIDDGKIFLDVNRNIKILSNIKINGMYCSFKNNKFNCSFFNDKNTEILEYKATSEYKVGDKITLFDNSKWHVINDSSKYSDYVVLLRDERVDINKDNFTIDLHILTDPDRIPFDVNKSKKYDVSKNGNIGHYIENTYRKEFAKSSDVYEIRLLYSAELESIRERVNFNQLTNDQIDIMIQTEEDVLSSIDWEYHRDKKRLSEIRISSEQYSKLMPHWLYNAFSGNYWLYPEGNKVKVTVWSGDGSYASPKPTTGYSLKPVVVINKKDL